MLLFFKMGTVVVAKDYGSVTIAHTHKGKCAAHARRPFTAKQLRDAKHSFMCRKEWSAIAGKSCLHEKHSKRRVSVSARIAAGYQKPGMVSIFPQKSGAHPGKPCYIRLFGVCSVLTNAQKRGIFEVFSQGKRCRERKEEVQQTLAFAGPFGGEEGIRTHVRLRAN